MKDNAYNLFKQRGNTDIHFLQSNKNIIKYMKIVNELMMSFVVFIYMLYDKLQTDN